MEVKRDTWITNPEKVLDGDRPRFELFEHDMESQGWVRIPCDKVLFSNGSLFVDDLAVQQAMKGYLSKIQERYELAMKEADRLKALMEDAA